MTTEIDFAAIEMPFAVAITCHASLFMREYNILRPADLLKSARCWFWHTLLEQGKVTEDSVPKDLYNTMPEWLNLSEAPDFVQKKFTVKDRLAISGEHATKFPETGVTPQKRELIFRAFAQQCVQDFVLSGMHEVSRYSLDEFYLQFNEVMSYRAEDIAERRRDLWEMTFPMMTTSTETLNAIITALE
jgi:hypothetical protein